MTRRIGRPVAADGEQTRRRILDVAVAQLGVRGYARMTLKGIADEVGITTAAVYHYFPSKRALVTVLLDEWTAGHLERVGYVAETEDTLAGQLVRLLEESADIYEEQPHLAPFAMSLHGDAQRYPELREPYVATSAAITRFYARLTNRAADRGELGAGANARGVQDLFQGLTYGLSCIAAMRGLERHRAAVRCAGDLIEGRLVTRSRGRTRRTAS